MEIDIGRRFKEIRQALKLSQKALAERLGTKQSKISKIENNNVKYDILFIINDICKLAGITVEEFLSNEKQEIIYLNEDVKNLIKIAQELDEEVIRKLATLLEVIVKHSN